ncbi:GGDEF domain-containing protein [Tistrella bauzanensis]
MPADGSYREVRDLALALRRMIRALTEKRVALEAANAGLEARVAERTAALTAEIEERRRIERDREDLIHRLKQMAETDFLTGVMNRRSFFDVASRDLTIALHHGSPLAVVMLDLDHFKQINDRYGHGVGDEVLRSVAERCRSAIRGGDLVARMGGEEFVILLHHAAADAAAALAERLRVALAGTPVALSDGRAIPITASLGVAVAGPDDTTIDELMTRADAALYRAKAAGRNRVAAAAVGGSA